MALTVKFNSSELHKHHRERMKHLYNVSELGTLSDHQILEILLYFAIPREDTNPMAHMLLNRFGSLAGVFDADEKLLMQIPGIGENAAFLLRYMPEIAERYLKSKRHPEHRLRFANTLDVLEYVDLCFFRAHERERLLLLGLNNLHELVQEQYSNEGSVDQVPENITTYLRAMCVNGCNDIIIAHFHPNGELRPSAEDNNLTVSIEKACSAIGMRLCDHIIAGNGKSVSCYEESGSPGFMAFADTVLHPLFKDSQKKQPRLARAGSV